MAAEEPPAPPVLFGLVATFLLASAVRTGDALLPPRARLLPFTAVMLLLGLAVGAVAQAAPPVAYMTDGVAALEGLSPAVIFSVLLPALIFPGAMAVEWHVFRRVAGHALLLATLGTAVNAALIALVARYVLPYDWSWAGAWLFGAILSATDPVATVAAMKATGASVKLATVVDGEALLNDGVAFVLFELIFEWAAGSPPSAGAAAAFVAKAALGGPALGLAWALALTAWWTLAYDDAVAEITISLVAAYSLWLVADELAGASGVLALVACGLALAAHGRARVSRGVAASFDAIWGWIDASANTLVFFISGLITSVEVIRSGNLIDRADWGWAAALFLLLVAIRAASVALLFPLLRRAPGGACGYALSPRDALMLTWSGLRGVVGLALALLVYRSDVQDEAFRAKLFFQVAMMAALTLLVQGSSAAWVMRALGYLRLPPAKQDVMARAARAVERAGAAQLAAARRRAHPLGAADWARVERLTALRLADKVERRPLARGGGGSRGAKDADALEMRDLRARLIAAFAAAAHEAFEAEFISPEEAYALGEAAEEARDALDGGLGDWQALFARLEPLGGGRAARAARRMHLALRGLGARHPLRRNAAVTCVFIFAHALARRDLAELVDLQLEGGADGAERGGAGGRADGAADGRGASAPAADAAAAADGRGASAPAADAAAAAVANDLAPFWRDLEEPKCARALAHGAGAGGRGADAARLRRCLGRVLAESRAEQARAAEYLEDLRRRNAEALREVRTQEVAVAVLRRERELLRRLTAAGVLDGREAVDVAAKLERRMKRLHGLYGIE